MPNPEAFADAGDCPFCDSRRGADGLTWHRIGCPNKPEYIETAPSVRAGWQDISTAPRDGTHVVLFGTLWNDPAQRPRACVSWYCTKRSDSPAHALGWFFAAPGYTNAFNATHWQPLPAPPGDTHE